MNKLETLAVEVNAVMHPNPRCAVCSHGSRLAKPSDTGPGVVSNNLSNLKSVAEAYEARIIGNEALLHHTRCGLPRAVRATESVVGQTLCPFLV